MVKRITPDEIIKEEEQPIKIVPPPAEIKTTPISPPPQKPIPKGFEKAKYKTFKEHLADIRKKVKKTGRKKKKK